MGVYASTSGRIPVLTSISDDESEKSSVSPEEATMAYAIRNPTVKAAFAINKMERDELIATRRRLNQLSAFLKKVL